MKVALSLSLSLYLNANANCYLAVNSLEASPALDPTQTPINYKATFIGWLFSFRGIERLAYHDTGVKVALSLSANAHRYLAVNSLDGQPRTKWIIRAFAELTPFHWHEPPHFYTPAKVVRERLVGVPRTLLEARPAELPFKKKGMGET